MRKRGGVGAVVFVVLLIIVIAFILISIVFYAGKPSPVPNDDGNTEPTGEPDSGDTGPVREPGGHGSCMMSTDCSGSAICISRRVCNVRMSGSCDCNGETNAGTCIDFSGTPMAGKECGLIGARCGDGSNPLCCQGNTCTNGKCEGNSGRCPVGLATV